MSTHAAPSIESLWRDFSARLGAFIRSRVGDAAAAEDIRQEVFVKIQRHLPRLREVAKMESWLLRIARNAIADHFRARREMDALDEQTPALADEPNDTPGALADTLRRLAAELPEPYRSAVTLADLEGVPQTELAARLGLSASGAKSRVQRGRALLKKTLLDCCRIELDRRGGVAACEPRSADACEACD